MKDFDMKKTMEQVEAKNILLKYQNLALSARDPEHWVEILVLKILEKEKSNSIKNQR